jgi:ion channel-forming bestrophin family protein
MIDYETRSWLGTLVHMRGSVLPKLVPRIIVYSILGAGAAYLHQRTGLSIPPVAHTLVGVALGLLLVFRTNASYDRFWEGRRLFGMLVNRCRDLVRQIVAYHGGDDAAGRRERETLVRHVNLLYALIRQFLRRERDLAVLGALATDEERAVLEPVAVRPTVVVTWIARALGRAADAGRMTEQRLQLLDGNLTSFVDSWGGAERILKTPIPFAYAQAIKLFLVLFCLTVPFALVESMRWATPAAVAVLAFCLFGIEEIGIEIEDPFGHDPNDLPLDRIGETIAVDTAAMIRLRD